MTHGAAREGSGPGHLVLLGAMGTGKSTVGALLAVRLNRPLVDSDAVIEATTGSDGRWIAAVEGVAALHDLERRVLLDALAEPEAQVIAAAASVVDTPHAVAAMRHHACVWLHADDGVLRARRPTGSHRRTLGPGEADRLARRTEVYASLAGCSVDTGAVDAATAASVIIGWLADR